MTAWSKSRRDSGPTGPADTEWSSSPAGEGRWNLDWNNGRNRDAATESAITPAGGKRPTIIVDVVPR